MTESNNGNSVKEYDEERVESRSVIERPKQTTNTPTASYGLDAQTFFFIQNYADEIMPWGGNVKLRDAQLRSFILQENTFASALGIICSRNSGFRWKLDGPPRTVALYQDILENANFGLGWHDLQTKTTLDISTQDNSAVWEFVRAKDNPESPVIGINHLDTARCWHTGVPRTPIVYQDIRGKYHLMKDYQVAVISEMPTAIERLYGIQYSTLTRVLRKMQTTRNIDIYDYEKTAGRATKAIHLVKGVTTQQLKDAMANARMGADNSGQLRYMDPVLIGTIDPTADVGHDTINMVDVPTGYNPESAFVQYINTIAMGFATDYQEFAPLPGQRLGTGAQSEVLHLKARGKGPGTYMRLITRIINYRVLPKNVQFYFDEQDLEAEKQQAEVKALRAQTRAVRINSGEITPEVARQIANDEGDLDYDYIQLMGEQDVTPDVSVNSDAPADVNGGNIAPGTPAPQQAPTNVTTTRNPTRGGGSTRAPVVSPPTPLGPKLR